MKKNSKLSLVAGFTVALLSVQPLSVGAATTPLSSVIVDLDATIVGGSCQISASTVDFGDIKLQSEPVNYKPIALADLNIELAGCSGYGTPTPKLLFERAAGTEAVGTNKFIFAKPDVTQNKAQGFGFAVYKQGVDPNTTSAGKLDTMVSVDPATPEPISLTAIDPSGGAAGLNGTYTFRAGVACVDCSSSVEGSLMGSLVIKFSYN
ncbi:fimbrial protein [Serratia microhaemolytica]|uniref:fimbrial protein n=1 Tax=Serratia microhaemolytica TaxID=2675110 RepID=UPI000FDCE2D8|nr:fimbrial protein [Serratia microhaemolytica]